MYKIKGNYGLDQGLTPKYRLKNIIVILINVDFNVDTCPDC